MAKTIIQTIGPLYGEAVNGTVFGRPNGSIYVPATNTITLTIPAEYRYVILDSGYVISDSEGNNYRTEPEAVLKVVAESQDLANYINVEISDDSEFSTVMGYRGTSAGLYNIAYGRFAYGVTEVVQDTTYYIRAVLMSANGEPVATSDVVEVSGVVVS